jgi:hypothetical protein
LEKIETAFAAWGLICGRRRLDPYRRPVEVRGVQELAGELLDPSGLRDIDVEMLQSPAITPGTSCHPDREKSFEQQFGVGRGRENLDAQTR